MNSFAASPNTQRRNGILWLLGSLGAGAGLMHFITLLAGSEPKAVINVLAGWGPWFAIAAGMLWVVDRRTGEIVGASRDNAAAQQRMADAIQQIAQKDDSRAREMELVIGHLSRNSEKTLEHLVEMRGQIAELQGRSAAVEKQ